MMENRKRMTQDSAIIEPPPGILARVMIIANKVARSGLEFENDFMHFNASIENSRPERPFSMKRFSFLKESDPYHPFYVKKRDEYIAQYRDGSFQPLRLEDLQPPPDRCQAAHTPIMGFQLPEMTLIEFGVVKLTAMFVARYGKHFWHDLIRTVSMSPHFSFLKPTDSKFCVYNWLLVVYQGFLKPGDFSPTSTALEGFFHCLQLEKLHENVLLDLHSFVYGLDHLYSMQGDRHLPPGIPLSGFLLGTPFRSQLTDASEPDLWPLRPCHPTFPVKITFMELGIIKHTALFVALYGKHFRRALMMRELMNPRFEFMFFRHDHRPQFPSMKPAELRFHIFSLLVHAYSKVLMPSRLAKDIGYCTGMAIVHFLEHLELGSLEEIGYMLDFHGFLAGVDNLAYIDDAEYSAIMAPPERLSVMMNWSPRTHPDVHVLLRLGPELSSYRHGKRALYLLKGTYPPDIKPEELGIIKLTSQFAMRYGMSFVKALRDIVSMDPPFEFLKLTSSRSIFFHEVIQLYVSVLKCSKKVNKSGDCMAMALEVFFQCLQLDKLKRGVKTSLIELDALTSGVDYFSFMDDGDDYSSIMDQPECRSVMMNRPPHRAQPDLEPPLLGNPTLRTPWSFPSTCPIGLSHRELGIMKLTAVFVARYGVRICWDLMKKVVMEPEFELFKFMEPTDRRFSFYKVVVDAYSKVLKASDDACTETVLERYFQCLQWEEDDLFGFVEGVDCFAQMEDDKYAAIMGNQLIQLHSCPYHQYGSPSMKRGMSSRPPLSLPEEPETKRPKFDESAHVPEASTSTIRVCVPTVDGRKVIDIKVKLLSENVASLKEKIAGVIQMPVHKLKIRGKTRVLKEDKSLADNNVGAGEILAVSWRISRYHSVDHHVHVEYNSAKRYKSAKYYNSAKRYKSAEYFKLASGSYSWDL